MLYYNTNNYRLRLIESTDWETIETIDHVLCNVVRELANLYRAYEAEGWRSSQQSTEYDEVTQSGFRLFVSPHIPKPTPLNQLKQRWAA